MNYHFSDKLKFVIFVFIFSLWSTNCSSTVRFSGEDSPLQKKPTAYRIGQVLKGKCSYYASKFHGRKTANGEIYDMYALTAAHRTLPFNTILEVENVVNGKKVRVRINDRGPFKAERILDVSYQAAKELDFIDQGTTEIRATIIRLGKKNSK